MDILWGNPPTLTRFPPPIRTFKSWEMEHYSKFNMNYLERKEVNPYHVLYMP